MNIEKQFITITIDTYINLQRIKKENGNQENREFDYQLKGIVAKLYSLGGKWQRYNTLTLI